MQQSYPLSIASLALTAWLAGCTYGDHAESTAEAASADDGASADAADMADMANVAGASCRTYGFRNWSLQRGEGALTLAGEASLPTPAWKIELRDSSDDLDIALVMETIEPTGLSSSVVSWITFQTTVETTLADEARVTVWCAGEAVWTSLQDETEG